MVNKLVLIGGGGHCKSVIDVALQMGIFSDIVITDPVLPAGTEILGCSVVGTDECLNRLYDSGYRYAFITVGSVGCNVLRGKLADKVASIGFDFPVIIDPSAKVSELASVGAGSFIGKNAIVNVDAEIGKHCIINTGAIIEHECVVNDFVHISVGCILCGGVSIGRNSFIGAGSTIIQCKSIGVNAVIGANSTVLTNIDDNLKRYGVVK